MAYLTLDIDAVDPSCLYLADPVPNAVLPRGEFHRVCYSNGSLSLRGVYIILPCRLLQDRRNLGWKNCRASCSCNDLNRLDAIEKALTALVPGTKGNWRLKDVLSDGPIRFNMQIPRDKIKQIVVKISGVWSTKKDCGLTYKLIPAA